MNFLDHLDKMMPEKIEDLFIPKFTEITLFLTSLIVFLLFIESVDFRESFFNFYIFTDDPKDLFVAAVILAGFMLSMFHVFIDEKIPNLSKFCMLFYVVIVNFWVGISAGFYLIEKSLRSSTGLNLFGGSFSLDIIFPILNIVNAIFILAMWRIKVLDEGAIVEVRVKRSEILFSSIAVAVIFIYSHFILNNYWAVTFSMCLAYATMINENINALLFKNKANRF